MQTNSRPNKTKIAPIHPSLSSSLGSSLPDISISMVPSISMSTGIDIEGPELADRFTLAFDSSLLAIDYLSFSTLTTESFRQLFPEPVVYLVVPGQKKAALELAVDQSDQVLKGKGLAKHLQSVASGNFITLMLTSSVPREFQVIVAAPIIDLDCENLGSSLVLQPGWQDVLRQLATSTFSSHDLFALHEQACTLDLCQPLDHLVSLGTLPDFVPYPHQIQAVKTVISKFRGRGLLCDEVGLGKTIEASLVMLEYILRGMAKKILILAPPSLCGQWQEELRTKFGLDFVINDETRFEGWNAHPFVIGSLAKAKLNPHCTELATIDYDLVIVDEAHHLRNRATKSWQLVNALKKRYIIFLTATPVQNSLSDLYSLVTLLKPGHLKTYQQFRKQFIAKDEFAPKNLDSLRELLQGVMIRNKRSHTNLILTKRYARTFDIELDAAEKELYDRITAIVRRGMLKQVGQRALVDQLTLQQLQLAAGSSVLAALSGLAKLSQRNLPESLKNEVVAVLEAGNRIAQNYSQVCSKARATAEIIKNFNDKVLIFTRFRETHDFLVSFLQGQGLKVATFNGSMKRIEKDAAIEQFKGEAQVLISSESGGEGRNLQFCRAIINYDLPWNPMRIEQRVGRIHRIGQQRDVHIFNLSARGTAEACVLDLLDKKINLFELVVGELDTILGELDTEREFEEIMFGIWAESQNEVEVSSRLEELGKKLTEAKAQYLRSQEFDDRVFGDALATTSKAP